MEGRKRTRPAAAGSAARLEGPQATAATAMAKTGYPLAKVLALVHRDEEHRSADLGAPPGCGSSGGSSLVEMMRTTTMVMRRSRSSTNVAKESLAQGGGDRGFGSRLPLATTTAMEAARPDQALHGCGRSWAARVAVLRFLSPSPKPWIGHRSTLIRSLRPATSIEPGEFAQRRGSFLPPSDSCWSSGRHRQRLSMQASYNLGWTQRPMQAAGPSMQAASRDSTAMRMNPLREMQAGAPRPAHLPSRGRSRR